MFVMCFLYFILSRITFVVSIFLFIVLLSNQFSFLKVMYIMLASLALIFLEHIILGQSISDYIKEKHGKGKKQC